jgi:hypothetical protein
MTGWGRILGHEPDLAQLLRAEWSFKSRTFTAQVNTVDPERGVVKIQVIGTEEELEATIPLGGLSLNAFRSSWQRYMPQKKEFVKVCFGPLNQVEIVGYSAFGEQPDPTAKDGRSGSPSSFIGAYATAQKIANRSSPSDQEGLGDFVQLKEGEFDSRSKGGAYIRGFDTGTLLFRAGGMVKLQMDKGRDEIVTRARTHGFCGDGTDNRFGEIKRPLGDPTQLPSPLDPTNPLTATHVPHPTGINKEWRVVVGYQALPLPAPPLTLYQREIGHVVDNDGIIEMGDSGLPLRHRARWYNDSGDTIIPTNETLKVEVDHLGNVAVLQGDSAVLGGVKVAGGALSPLEVTFNEINVSSQLATTIEAQTTLDLSGLTGVNINAGGAADQAVVRGDDLNLYLTTKLTVPTALGPSGPSTVPLMAGTELSLLAKVK